MFGWRERLNGLTWWHIYDRNFFMIASEWSQVFLLSEWSRLLGDSDSRRHLSSWWAKHFDTNVYTLHLINLRLRSKKFKPIPSKCGKYLCWLMESQCCCCCVWSRKKVVSCKFHRITFFTSWHFLLLFRETISSLSIIK